METVIKVLLRFLGYAKVPPEIAQLACQARLKWQRYPADVEVGLALSTIENLARSARKL